MIQKGFTLVELSIVLVIIGLLIGGILVAQSMISTAKISSTVSQIQQFDSGVANFRTKYKSLPGDSKAFGGNGDGSITFDAGGFALTHVFAQEIATFWNNFEPALYSSNNLWSGTAAVSSGSNRNVPASKLGKSGSFFIASALSSPGFMTPLASGLNYYAIIDSTQAQAADGSGYYSFKETNLQNSPISPVDLLAFDSKMDDGKPTTGSVRSGNINSGAGGGTGGIDLSPLPECSSATYRVDIKTPTCNALIRIGSQTGTEE